MALARVILKDAPIVILDEATANLDRATEAKVVRALDAFLRGRTALIISHRPALLGLTSRRLVLGEGSPYVRTSVEGYVRTSVEGERA
jgi:ABC-type multidrug transport system fused ATPase/permease subunit